MFCSVYFILRVRIPYACSKELLLASANLKDCSLQSKDVSSTFKGLERLTLNPSNFQGFLKHTMNIHKKQAKPLL